MDISSKKQRDETNESSARAQSKIQSYEMRTVETKSALNVNGNSNSAEIVNVDMEDDESSNNSDFPPSERETALRKYSLHPIHKHYKCRCQLIAPRFITVQRCVWTNKAARLA